MRPRRSRSRSKLSAMAGFALSLPTAPRFRATPRTTARSSAVASRPETKSNSARRPVPCASIIRTGRFENRSGQVARSGRAGPLGPEGPRPRFTAPYRPTSLDRSAKTTSASNFGEYFSVNVEIQPVHNLTPKTPSLRALTTKTLKNASKSARQPLPRSSSAIPLDAFSLCAAFGSRRTAAAAPLR
jgi:hypothetical protein